jgi:hypothetical protein
MGLPLLILAATIIQQSPRADTGAFGSPAVQELVTRATARRRLTDSAVADYQATVQYRLSLGFGRRQWARIPPAVVEEQVAKIQWQLPNDLRVDVEGRRSGSRSGMMKLSSVFDRPWFVPRDVGDSLRIFSNDFPATGALHPLSVAGPAWYRYAQVGGLGVVLPDGRALRLIEIEVMPRRTGPALIAGRLWIDSATADVVRLAFRYVGTSLWARVGDPKASDSGAARRINAIANRVLSINAEIEYALQEGRYWMPYRQAVFGTARIPIISDLVIPFRAVTVFDDYAINTHRPVTFTMPIDSGRGPGTGDTVRVMRRAGPRDDADSARAWDYAGRWPGGRYELHRPSDDSLTRYTGWTAPLVLRNPSAEDEHLHDLEGTLAEAAEALPGELTGRTDRGFSYERLGDLLQYNRVQGVSFGFGYRLRVPMLRFTSLYGTARYGLSDHRLTGRLAIRSDAPGGRFTLSGYRDVRGVDPFAPGQTFTNSANAIFAAHDDGDYLVASGASVEVETSVGLGVDFAAGARVVREGSAALTAKSAVNDFLGGAGLFPLNPAITPGTFGGMFVRVNGFGPARWTMTADVLGSERQAVARLYGELRRDVGGRRGATLRLKAGLGTEQSAAAPLPQMAFRLGGVHTVRGFVYGYEQAPSFWSAQLDVTPSSGLIRPVAFLDAGQAGRTADLFSGNALVGGGVGLSLLRGMVRFDFSVPISPDIGGKVRFDFVMHGVR